MPRQINNFVPGVISSELRNAGVLCTMDNVFKADPIVKQSLNDTHRICRVHVGDNSLTSSSVNDIFQAGLSDNIYCAKGVYMHRRSRYDRSASTMSQSELRPSRLFVSESSTSRQDIVNKLAQAEKKYREVDDEIKALTQQSVGIRQELQQITNDRKLLNMKAQEPEAKRKKLLTKISHNKQLLKEDEKAASVEAIEKRYEEQSKKLTGNRVEAAIDLIDQVLLSHKICSEANVECLIGVERLVRTQRQTEIISAIELRFTAEREKRDDFKERLKTARDQLAAKKQEAMDIAPLTPEIQEQFARWPKTIEELDNEIKTKREQADAILCQNPSALEEYKNRTKEMSDLTKAIETESSLLAGKQSEIQVVKDRWLPKLQRIIAKISERFADNFAHIACAGQITLAGDGSREHGGFGDEFKDYSLEIRVKFRANEEMHLLDSHRQSGGERSVSTMLYMIALQGFTSAPFRVVDEINQGMDARNERKVFKRMVEAASVPGTPQCFVVTPKLLTQLTYSEDCTVMCIFNGPHVHQMASRWREMQAAFDAKKVPTPTR
jgi:chromosome segregation ATPase